MLQNGIELGDEFLGPLGPVRILLALQHELAYLDTAWFELFVGQYVRAECCKQKEAAAAMATGHVTLAKKSFLVDEVNSDAGPRWWAMAKRPGAPQTWSRRLEVESGQ